MSKKISIKAKILVVMLFLTVVTFGLAAIFTLDNISRLGKFTLRSCDDLGENNLDTSRAALLKHGREELLSLVVGQAAIANVQLDRLEDELNMLASLSGRYLLEDEKSFKRSNEQRFLTTEKPFPLLSKSRIVVYPENNKAKLPTDMKRMGRLHPLLKFIYGNQRNLDMVYVCTANGYYVSYPWTKRREAYSPYNREWYKAAVKEPDKTVWTGPYISANANKIIITCSKAVKDSEGRIIAVCGSDITIKHIVNSFISMQAILSGRAFLIDQDGNVLARHNMRSNGMTWNENLKKENLFKSKNKSLQRMAAKMVTGEEGVEKINLPDEPELYVAYAPVFRTGWSIGVAVKSDVLTHPVKKVERVMERRIQIHRVHIRDYFNKNLNFYLIAGLLVSVLVIAWSFFFSQKITEPVMMLQEKAFNIMGGNFNSNIHLNTGDELERLDKTFDKMSQEISSYIQHVSNTVREREKIEQEFKVASNIQSLMLPSKFKTLPELAVESYLKPAHEVSGDFYNYFMLNDRKLFFCIGKVTGKGVPAAMLMSQAMTLLSHLGSMEIAPEELLLIVNNALVINNKTDMSVTAFCAYLDIKSGKLTFSNAEDVPTAYLHEDAALGPDTEKSLALGIHPVKKGVFKPKSLQLNSGDILLFTTNGIDKAENERGEIFGEKYLLSSMKNFSAEKDSVIKFALEQLKEFYGAKISQIDVALLSIEYKGGEL